MTVPESLPGTDFDTAGEDANRRATAATISVAIADQQLRGEVLGALRQLSVPVIEENCDTDRLENLLASIELLRPHVLMLGLSGLPCDPASAVARIATLELAPSIVAVHDSVDPETILRVIRAGASEFVYPPFSSSAFLDSVRRAISGCGAVARPERATGSVIGFVSAKGGCGSTTLACHCSSWLRRTTGKQVLLADLDVASGIAGAIMQATARYTLEDALQNLHRMDLKLWKAMVAGSPSGVDVIPASPAPPTPGITLSRRMPQMLRFWRMQYDISVLDFGHGIAEPLQGVLDAIDMLVLVTTNEVMALKQAKRIIHSLASQSFGANRLKLVINRMPRRTTIEVPELEQVMGHPIYAVVPNDYQRVNEAYAEPRLLEHNCELEMRIGQLAARLGGIQTEEKKPKPFFGLWGRN